MSSQPASVPVMSSKSTSGLRSKQAAVASMFKAAKASATSSATTAAAPVNATSPSAAFQQEDSRDDSAMFDAANVVGKQDEELLLGAHVAATDMTAAPSPAADMNSTRLKEDTSCQPSTHAAQRVEDDAGPPECEERSDVAAQVSSSVKDGQTFLHVPNCSDEQCSHDAHAAPGNSLSNVDLAEQKQIMHDLWLERNALSSRNAAKRPAPATKAGNKRIKLSTTGKGKQTQLSALLKKVPPP